MFTSDDFFLAAEADGGVRREKLRYAFVALFKFKVGGGGGESWGGGRGGDDAREKLREGTGSEV